MSEDREQGDASVPGVIATLITIAGFAVLLSTQRLQLSIIEQVVYALIISASAVAFFIWIWYRPIRTRYEGWKRNRSARRHFHELTTLFDTFKQFVDTPAAHP